MTGRYFRYFLDFKRPSGTSRGVLTQKETWFLILEEGTKTGWGECGLLRGLSADDRPDYEEKLQWVCNNLHLEKEVLLNHLKEYPSIQFGLEQALHSLRSTSPFHLFPSEFTRGTEGIPINGLVWMGTEEFMQKQIEEKLSQGFNCLKLKIGAIDFEAEMRLLRSVRKRYSPQTVEIRVDANGGFSPQQAPSRLEALSKLHIHSIEQPIKAGQWEEMAELCKNTPLPIALDEELIGVFDQKDKQDLLEVIRPQYIILKPSLIGGLKGSESWIQLAESLGAGWWITSALESNVGLNAIAQFTYTLKSNLPQGLGTGGLFTNNPESPLEVYGGNLFYRPERSWDLSILDQN